MAADRGCHAERSRRVRPHRHGERARGMLTVSPGFRPGASWCGWCHRLNKSPRRKPGDSAWRRIPAATRNDLDASDRIGMASGLAACSRCPRASAQGLLATNTARLYTFAYDAYPRHDLPPRTAGFFSHVDNLRLLDAGRRPRLGGQSRSDSCPQREARSRCHWGDAWAERRANLRPARHR